MLDTRQTELLETLGKRTVHEYLTNSEYDERDSLPLPTHDDAMNGIVGEQRTRASIALERTHPIATLSNSALMVKLQHILGAYYNGCVVSCLDIG